MITRTVLSRGLVRGRTREDSSGGEVAAEYQALRFPPLWYETNYSEIR